MTKEERLAAFKNYRVVLVEERPYAIATIDFGRRPGEALVQDMYQRLDIAADAVGKRWYGTMLAADHAHDARVAWSNELRVAAGNPTRDVDRT